MAISHFKNLFKASLEVSLAEVIQIAQDFPCYVDEEDSEELMGEVTRGEVKGIVKSMPKDKSPVPDNWSVELFQHFFETIGSELTEVVEESRRK